MFTYIFRYINRALSMTIQPGTQNITDVVKAEN